MTIRAIYEDGYLRLLDPLTLTTGQEVKLTIETPSEQDTLRDVLGDLVRWATPADDRDAWAEAEADRIDQAFQGTPPLSQIILEERGKAAWLSRGLKP